MRIVGILMVIILFVVFNFFMIRDIGIKEAVQVLLIAGGIMVWIGISVYLMFKGG